MAMKFFQPALRLTKGLELDIWRESNLVESYGTSKEGLALAAARRGFATYTMGISRKHSFVDEISNRIPSVDRDVLEFLYRDIRSKFRALGLNNVSCPIKLQTLKALLTKSHIPLFLTSTSMFGGKEDLPHWVVLTGYSGDASYVNNPLANGPNTRVEQERLERYLGYRGVQCAVVIRGLVKGTAQKISLKSEQP
jgi:hypothetical protein